jgi:hypothetical protein
MIILETILGYWAARKIAESQTTQFFLTYEMHTHETPDNEPKKPSDDPAMAKLLSSKEFVLI